MYALDTYLWSDIVDNVKEQWWEGVTEKFLTKIMFLFEKFQHYVEPPLKKVLIEVGDLRRNKRGITRDFYFKQSYQ